MKKEFFEYLNLIFENRGEQLLEVAEEQQQENPHLVSMLSLFFMFSKNKRVEDVLRSLNPPQEVFSIFVDIQRVEYVVSELNEKGYSVDLYDILISLRVIYTLRWLKMLINQNRTNTPQEEKDIAEIINATKALQKRYERRLEKKGGLGSNTNAYMDAFKKEDMPIDLELFSTHIVLSDPTIAKSGNEQFLLNLIVIMVETGIRHKCAFKALRAILKGKKETYSKGIVGEIIKSSGKPYAAQLKYDFQDLFHIVFENKKIDGLLTEEKFFETFQHGEYDHSYKRYYMETLNNLISIA